eukprot:scaffold135295_cov51-Attheya_sp.AAC.1
MGCSLRKVISSLLTVPLLLLVVWQLGSGRLIHGGWTSAIKVNVDDVVNVDAVGNVDAVLGNVDHVVFGYTLLQPSDLQLDEFVVITATSSNHFAENLCMLKNLIANNYDGPLFVYVMSLPTEKDMPKLRKYVAQLEKFPFTRLTVIEVEIPYERYYKSYCWKPAVIAETMSRLRSKLKIFYWSDSSPRVSLNPFDYAKTMWKASVAFSGTEGGDLGMGVNTVQATYDFLNLDIHHFKNETAIAATCFMMNVNNTVANRILDEWVDCAVNHCQTCMAPSMDTKLRSGLRYPPSTVNIVHRQDQSVLSLLVHQAIRQNEGNLQVQTREDFMNMTRGGKVCT